MSSDQWGVCAVVSIAIGLGAAWGVLVGWLAVAAAGVAVVVCTVLAARKQRG